MKKFLLLAASAALFTGSYSRADSLVNYKIVGNTDGSNTYTDSLTVNAGDVVHYQVQATIAPIGTVGGPTANKTITTLTPGTDGIITSAFNLVDSDPASIGGTFSTASLVSGAQGPSSTGGTVGASALNGIKIAVDTTSGASPFGVIGTDTPGYQVLLNGTFTVGSGATGTATIGETYAAAGSFKINNGSSTFVSSATNDAIYNSFAALTLTTPSTVPAPSELGGSAIAAVGMGLVALRRRRNRLA